jgi:hypothetical protein
MQKKFMNPGQHHTKIVIIVDVLPVTRKFLAGMSLKLQ